MKKNNKHLDDVCRIEGSVYSDNRGNFLKAFDDGSELLTNYVVKQVNYVESHQRYTLRGLHFQQHDFAEAKLFRVVKGSVQLAWVNVMKGGKRYLKADTIVLEEAGTGVLVPRGYATGYLTLEPNTIVLYMSDNQYSPENESGLPWNDPKLNIQWDSFSPALSEKDKAWPFL